MSDLPSPLRPVQNRPYKSSGEDHVTMGVPGMSDTKMIFHATGERTGGSLVVYEIHWAPDDASGNHVHTLEDEGFYVIEGMLTLHAEDGDTVLGPGDFGWAPRNVRHGYTVGPEGARVLLVQVPGTGLPSFFRILAETGHNPYESDASFAAFNAWSQENFGVTFMR